jgi:tRNA1(Val) A37 N6-methylase TrmN6
MAEAQIDALLGGRLLLRQAEGGHRAGTDAMLLAACAPAGFAGLCVDWGAGVGAVGLAVAALNPACTVRLVEIDPETAELARRNIDLNGLAQRATVIETDVLADRTTRRAAGIGAGDADLVLTNPPYLDAASAQVAPHARRALAHVMPAGGLAAWMRAIADALRPGGTVVVVHRADALPALLAAMAPRFGGIAVVACHPREGTAAVRVLVQGMLASRAPFALRPALVLHGPDGRFTPEADAINRGERRIAFRQEA